MEVTTIERALRHPRTSTNRIEELYKEYFDLIDLFDFFDDDDALFMMFYNHPNCPCWIKDEIDKYFFVLGDHCDSVDDYLKAEEYGLYCSEDSTDNDNIGHDEENYHFEPSNGWISED